MRQTVSRITEPYQECHAVHGSPGTDGRVYMCRRGERVADSYLRRKHQFTALKTEASESIRQHPVSEFWI